MIGMAGSVVVAWLPGCLFHMDVGSTARDWAASLVAIHIGQTDYKASGKLGECDVFSIVFSVDLIVVVALYVARTSQVQAVLGRFDKST